MRIVIDGAHGGGKSTFLRGLQNRDDIPCIARSGDSIFSDLIGKSFFIGRQRKIVPPRNQEDWNKLFQIIVDNGIEQFNLGCGSSVYWYDRGIHYAKVIAEMDGNLFPTELSDRMQSYVYDYAFIFEPIDSCDFTKIHKAGCRTFSIKDRHECVDLTYSIYEKSGSRVCKVPFYSYDYAENFEQRNMLIRNFIKNHPL